LAHIALVRQRYVADGGEGAERSLRCQDEGHYLVRAERD
jgi:hypothetical protein